MNLSYKNSKGEQKNFEVKGRIILLRGMSAEDEVEFCAALEKAFSSDPLESCDDWDRHKDSVGLDGLITQACVQVDSIGNNAKYGFEINQDGTLATYTSDQLVYGVRYIGGSNYSCFTSITDDERVEAIMSLTKEANPSRFYRLEEVYNSVDEDTLCFLKDLFADIDRDFPNARKVLIMPKMSVLSEELYGVLAFAFASVSDADLIVLSGCGELSDFVANHLEDVGLC